MFIEIEPILSITGQMSILLMLQQISSCAATTDSEAAVLVIPMDLPCTSKPDESEETDRVCWASNPAALYRIGKNRGITAPEINIFPPRVQCEVQLHVCWHLSRTT